MSGAPPSEKPSQKEPPISSVQIKTWIDLTFKKPHDPQRLMLRNKLSSTYSDYFQQLNESQGYMPFTLMSINNYGVDAKEIYDYVLSYRSSLSAVPTIEQMEVMGIAALMDYTLPKSEEEVVSVKPNELIPRMSNAQSLNAHEDWLTSLAFVTYYKDFQFEASVKNRAYEDGVTYLQSLKSGATLDAIQHVYGNLIKAIYPSIDGTAPTIEEGICTMHKGMVLMSNMLSPNLFAYSNLIGNEKPGRLKRNHLNDLLDDYNRALEDREGEDDKNKQSERLAEIFAKYVFIHPHPDANNSMARILVNNYLATHGYMQIDWSKLKTDDKANKEFNEHVFNWWMYEEWELTDWFANRLK